MPIQQPSPITLDVFNPDLPLTTSQWADQHRYLSSLTSAEPGRWRTERTPYLQEPMDALTDPEVEQITIRAATQVGKTELILNCLGYIVDQDPSPTMIVLPRDDDAKNWGQKRVVPMIKESPKLFAHATGKEDDLAGKTYRFDRMLLKFAGANSPADLAGDPCRFVFFDEVDKYPKFSGREADPVKLGKERARTFWNRKYINVSTPTTTEGYITREYEASDKRRYFVRCPSCGLYQPLTFSRKEGAASGRVWFPEGKTPDEIKAERLAMYECGACRELIGEEYKQTMLEHGVWCPGGCTVSTAREIVGDRPQITRHRGYHLPALYSPWVSWSEIAAEFLEAQGSHSLLMAFVNSVLAEPWVEQSQKTTSKHLETRRGAHAFGEVPQPVLLITAGVDVQEHCFYFVLRGWGYGEESWLIRYGQVATKEELTGVLIDTVYQKEGGGETLPVHLACIDSGYRTNEIYHYCRTKHERLRPIKGHDHLTGLPHRVTQIDRDTLGKVIPGGLGLWNLDVNYYKDKLNRLIHTEAGHDSEWHLPEIVEPEYFAHMTAEQKITVRNKRTGVVTKEWRPITESAANHYWDCEIYALSAADMLKVYLLRPVGSVPNVYQPKRKSSWIGGGQDSGGTPQRGSRSGGWLSR